MTRGAGPPSGARGPERPGAGSPGSGSKLGPGVEFDLIRRFLGESSPERPAGELLGPGDDCAVVVGSGIALSTDMCVEDVHFRRAWLSSDEVGWRAASAALSDLAAVAARPIGVLVSCAFSPADAVEMAPSVMAGVRAATEAVGGVLLGGDLTRSPGPIVIDVTVVGETSRPIRRSGAAPGDEIWVTGALGGSAAALDALSRGDVPSPAARLRFARPLPRIRESLWLAELVRPGSMIDISDGLAGDAGHIAAASGVAMVLEADAVPVDPAAAVGRAYPDAIRLALEAGEDYELCFTVTAGSMDGLLQRFEEEMGIAVRRVGRVEEGTGVHLVGPDGRRRLERGGFQHFGAAS
jgi:thiamine-monophosphate kinase